MLSMHSRAAVICLGGWGLQTMLHIWPRLQATQAVRYSLPDGSRLSDLTRNSAFVCVMPEVVSPNVISADERTFYRPFRVLQPNPAAVPGTFYLEELLAQTRQRSGPEAFPRRTHAERIGASLLQQVEQATTPLLRDIPLGRPTVPRLPPVGRRLSRTEMFEQGIIWAESVARAIIEQVIEPTRLDELEPADPFVRTSLFVVASLAEPTTSPLIWPLLIELMAMLGNRHLVSVIGLLATGSFASDPVEDAAAYTALRELLALQGAQAGTAGRPPLEQLLKATAVPHWADRAGQPVFNRIYLLDREKSNQSRARDSAELAVLAGNAIEAFLITGATHYIEQVLGFAANGSQEAPYSLIGTAGTYVPLVQYLQAAALEERKRLVREHVLTAAPVTELARLEDLGVAPEATVQSLVDASEPIFAPPVRFWRTRLPWPWQREESALVPGLLPEMRVAAHYLYPPAVATELRRRPQLWHWRLLVEAQAERVLARLPHDLQTGYFETTWGLHYWLPPAQPDDPAAVLATCREQTWTRRHCSDRRVLPAAVSEALFRTSAEIAAAPNGLAQALARLRDWLAASDAVQDAVRLRTDAAERNAREAADQRAYRAWLRDFVQATAAEPHSAAVWTRAFLPTLLLLYLVCTWLLDVVPQPAVASGWVAAAALCVGLIGLLALGPLLAARLRTRAVRARRLELLQQRAARLANERLHDSLLNVYARLSEELTLLAHPLEEAEAELRQWSRPVESSPIPPPGITLTHLRQPLSRDEIWQQVQSLVEGRRNAEGQTAAQAFVARWTTEGRDLRAWQDPGPSLVQQVRLAGEWPFHERELRQAQGLVEMEARRRIRVQTAPGAAPLGSIPTAVEWQREQINHDLVEGHWCAFATGQEPNHPLPEQRPTCVACPNLTRYRCPFSNAGRWQRPEWGVAGLVRDHTEHATAHLQPHRTALLGDSKFVRDLVERYAIERLLVPAGNGRADPVGTGAVVEELWVRAKPSALYESDSGGLRGLEVQFLVTPNGRTSHLRASLDRREMGILASHDPLSLLAVRTVNDLQPDQVLLIERCADAYMRLHPADRALISLFDTEDDNALLYGKVPDDVVPYQQSLAPRVGGEP